jgi:nucleotide-binding universal stress UspA family protein
MKWFHEKKILVPFDFSEQSVEAVKVALKISDEQSDVNVAYVCPNLNAAEPAVIWGAIDDEKRRTHATAEMVKMLSDLDAADVQLHVGFGDPGHVIADLARDISTGLIIISSHGRSGVKRLLLGSVAERVVRLAKCPVLVLKAGQSSG